MRGFLTSGKPDPFLLEGVCRREGYTPGAPGELAPLLRDRRARERELVGLEGALRRWLAREGVAWRLEATPFGWLFQARKGERRVAVEAGRASGPQGTPSLPLS